MMHIMCQAIVQFCPLSLPVCTLSQYDLNLAGSALDYVGGDADRLSDPLVSPLLAEYGRGHGTPPTLIQVRTKGLIGDSQVFWSSSESIGGRGRESGTEWIPTLRTINERGVRGQLASHHPLCPPSPSRAFGGLSSP